MLKSTVSSAKEVVANKVKEAKQQMRKQEREAKQKHEEMLARANARPPLLENWAGGTARANANLKKSKTINEFVGVLKDAGMSDAQAAKHLSMEDKEILEEEKFMEARKKQYGRM